MEEMDFSRSGARLQSDGTTWLCLGCGLPVTEGDLVESFDEKHDRKIMVHGVAVSFDAQSQEVTETCGRRIGKVIDMAKLYELRRQWLLNTADESFALPGYFRRKLLSDLKITKKPTRRKIKMWFTEVSETLQHSMETCSVRPPLSKREQEAAKSGLGRMRWA